MSADWRRPAELEITSPANPRIKQIVALRRRRGREQAGVTLVEGLAEIELALAAGVRPRTLYYCPALAAPASSPLAGRRPSLAGRGGPSAGSEASLAGRVAPAVGRGGPSAGSEASLAGRVAPAVGRGGPSADSEASLADRVAALGAEVVRVSRPVFEKIAYREGPDGWLAVVPAVASGLDRLDLGPRPLVLICAGLEKPGNLGAILRTADAAGVAAVIAADPVTDWGNPNVVRASKGTIFSVPVASADSAEVLDWASDLGLQIVAATPDAKQLVSETDLTGPTAIAVGAEQTGLSAQWLERADVRVRIPMFGRADSLNVSTSAAIITYEAVRQRLQAGDLKNHLPVG
jgi:RNA methyltransferase, TrmH family